MSDLTFPQPNSESMELAAANRKLTTAILGMTLLTGLVACLSYLAGRTVTHMRTETATVVRTEIPAAPIIVSPLAKPSPTLTVESLPPPAAPPAAPPVSAGAYFQVGLLNPAIDRSMEERLVQLGYSVKLAPMEDSPNSRILVGPIQSAAHRAELATKLRIDGYQFFSRQY